MLWYKAWLETRGRFLIGLALMTCAAAGLAEWLAIALAPQLVLTLFSPAVGQTFSLTDALVHGLCAFVAGAVFFSLAFLLSTEFSDLWRPLLTTLIVAMVLGSIEGFVRDLSPYGIFSVMNGEAYFRTGQLPWIG